MTCNKDASLLKLLFSNVYGFFKWERSLYFWDKEAKCVPSVLRHSPTINVLFWRAGSLFDGSQISEMCLNLPRLTRQSLPIIKRSPQICWKSRKKESLVKYESQNPLDWRARVLCPCFRFICIYPVYINSKKTLAEGRRIPSEKVTWTSEVFGASCHHKN